MNWFWKQPVSTPALENITNWLKPNKLAVNVAKLQLLFFDLSPSPNKADALNIQINSQKLVHSKSVRYLGVVIDKKLKRIPKPCNYNIMYKKKL